jgi:endonuclease/exonuclease/phosphatase (EEP) superfamily protein YafD
VAGEPHGDGVAAERTSVRTSVPTSVWTAAWVAAWIISACCGVLALTQAFGVTPWVVAFVAQSFTPYVLVVAAPVAVLASVHRRWRLASVNVGVAVSVLWLLYPVVFPPGGADVAADAPTFTLLSANVLYTNPRMADAAAQLLEVDADVMAFTEYTSELAVRLDQLGAFDEYPYRKASPSLQRSGLALYSRFPILRSDVVQLGAEDAIVATLVVQGTVVRIVVVHPMPGIDRAALTSWRRDLTTYDDVARSPGPPTVLVGDFNSSRFHPAFRHLLDDLTDAHEQAGAAWSMSWPNDRSTPPFVRLDHALLDDLVVATHVDEVDVAGSDHRAFEVSLSVLP